MQYVSTHDLGEGTQQLITLQIQTREITGIYKKYRRRPDSQYRSLGKALKVVFSLLCRTKSLLSHINDPSPHPLMTVPSLTSICFYARRLFLAAPCRPLVLAGDLTRLRLLSTTVISQDR